MVKIFLVRHGDAGFRSDSDNLLSSYSYSSRVPLSSLGCEQMIYSANWIRGNLSGDDVPFEKVSVACGTSVRTSEAKDIFLKILQGANNLGERNFLAEIGRGALGDKPASFLKDFSVIFSTTSPERLVVNEHLEKGKREGDKLVDHYNDNYPGNLSPAVIECVIEGDLLNFVCDEEKDSQAIIIVGNAGKLLLVEKILAGHNEEWFNNNFTKASRPERGSIRELVGSVEKGFKSNGAIFKGEGEEGYPSLSKNENGQSKNGFERC